MDKREGIFSGADPFKIFKNWHEEAEKSELNDPNAIALATVDVDGLPNVRMVLLKGLEKQSFVFYTNYMSTKGKELALSGKAAFAIHWKSLRRQIRVRGVVEKEDGTIADRYFATRARDSRIGAWASKQSQPLSSRQDLLNRVESLSNEKGENPERPPHWGGFRILPLEIEFWADGDFRLHDRFQWKRSTLTSKWDVQRLSP